jgi:hypothetical protein
MRSLGGDDPSKHGGVRQAHRWRCSA